MNKPPQHTLGPWQYVGENTIIGSDGEPIVKVRGLVQ